MNKFFIFLFVLPSLVVCQNINIAIYNSNTITEFAFRADSGKYDIISNNKLISTLAEGESIVFSIKKNKMLISTIGEELIGKHKEIHIRGRKQSDIFSVNPLHSSAVARSYDNDLYVYLDGNKFRLVNDVNYEKYIAGVVEAEGGSRAPKEYYKTQAILCRTYSLKHFDKHLESGFNLCDEVHCQAYKGRSIHNKDIYKAALETAGLVIVDEHLRVISATFFANSGGETVNSEDVWSNKVSYLRGRIDEYSHNQPGSVWERKIDLEQWNDYLVTKNIQPSKNIVDYNFKQIKRQRNYVFNGSSVHLTVIRKDWNLRSTFFSIQVEGNTLLFKGKGYGHGVGLSQEGAMQMARKGFNYEDIIKHYYTGVSIMSIKALDFFQVE